MTVALIDGDTVAYRCAVIGQEDVDWGDGEPSRVVRTDYAASRAIEMCRKWIKATKSRNAILAFSDDNNFRKILCDTYKANRKGPKPDCYRDVVDRLKAEFTSYVFPYCEGDDVLGILQTCGRWDTIIISNDKDMMTVPGRHWNPFTNVKKTVKPPQAEFSWMMQTLTGDSVDGYKGCPGVGAKRAERLLKSARSQNLMDLWALVVKEFEKAGLDEEHAIQQARLAKILTHVDYDRTNDQILLWCPEGTVKFSHESSGESNGN